MDMFEQVSHEHFVYALGGLVVLVFLSLGLRFLVRKVSFMRTGKGTGKMTRVLDVCHVDADRKLVLFSCPFRQGLLLASSKGDQVILFDPKDDLLTEK